MAKKEVIRRKVHIKTFGGEVMWGYVYIVPGDRLQDVVNDDRKFLPLERAITDRSPAPEYTCVMVNKDMIASIEEREG